MTLAITELTSPIGDIRLALSDGRLYALGFADRWPRLQAALERRLDRPQLRPAEHAAELVGRLAAYFAGDLAALDRIQVAPAGTPFQLKVWTQLRRIPTGQTVTYSDIASAIGAPTAVRAVGAANGANPISIVIPCHRVIGADGRLTGYGGGLDRKRWLLEHEGVRCAEQLGDEPKEATKAEEELALRFNPPLSPPW